MAKAGEKGEQKANLYLLAIVAIVAVVGIVVLVLNSGGVSVSTDDLSGQAVRSSSSAALSCRVCPDNCMYTASTGKYACQSALDSNLIKDAFATATSVQGVDSLGDCPSGCCPSNGGFCICAPECG